MIEIPRPLLRQFRLAWKRSLPAHTGRTPVPWVVVETARDHLSLQIRHEETALRCQVTTQQTPAVLCLPALALQEAEGRTGNVTLGRSGDNVVARWTEQSIPHVVEYDTADPAALPPFPELPRSSSTNPPALLKALDDAMHTVGLQSPRYATTHVQLRGSGEVVATDGKQLLLQGGFQFPWKDSVLIPRVALFDSGVLPVSGPVKVGRSAKHAIVQAGGWTVALPLNTEGRYPRIEEVIPRPALTTWMLSPADVALLLRSLPQLPGAKEENGPVTVDLHGKVAIRGWSSGQSNPAELILEQSKISGPPLRFSTNRNFLLRALQLGFREVRIVNADTPLLCQDEKRKFVWMPLPKAEAIRPHRDVIPIRPQEDEARPQRRKRTVSGPRPRPGPVIVPLPVPATVPEANPPTVPSPVALPAKRSCVAALIEEAQVLKAALGGMFARSRQLVCALQAHRKEARVVDSTLKSLRKLQTRVTGSSTPPVATKDESRSE